MAKEKEEQPRPQFGAPVVHGDNTKVNQVAGDLVEGDKVEGDKHQDNSQGKVVVEGDMTGGTITTTVNNNPAVDQLREATNELLSNLVADAPEMTDEQLDSLLTEFGTQEPSTSSVSPDKPLDPPNIPENEEIPGESPTEPHTEPAFPVKTAADIESEYGQEEQPHFENNEDHPRLLMAQMSFHEQNGFRDEAEEQSMFARLKSCVSKYATTDNASTVLSTIDKVANTDLAQALIPPPLNLVGPVAKIFSTLLKRVE